MLQILRRGELQINNLERQHALHSLSREIATLVSEMTVDPTANPPRKHTVGMVEKAMGEVGYSVKADKPAKAQALELIKRLGEGDVLPIRRVRMRVRVTMPGKDGKRIGDKVKAEGEVEEEDAGQEWEVVSADGVCIADAADHANRPQCVPHAHRSGVERKQGEGTRGEHGQCGGVIGLCMYSFRVMERA
jgi:ribosome maturation protein Sdo1